MTSARQLGWFFVGFAAATLAAAVFKADHARAQEISADAGTRAVPRLKTDPLIEVDGAYETPAKTSSVAPSEGEAADTAERGEESPDDHQGTDGDRPPRSGDGEEPAAEDPQTVADGPISVSEPEAPEDGADATRDTRPIEDVAVFANPPAGNDPLLFQIEDIQPLTTDRRPERLFRLEPYDPVGIRIGSFVLFPQAEIEGIATNNVQGTAGGSHDVGAGFRTSTRLVSNWSQHALEFRASTLSTYYDDFSSEDDRAWNAEARGRLDITRRINLQGLISHDVSQEQRSAIDATRSGSRPDVTTDQASLTLNTRFNRLSVQLRGAVSETDYSATGAGVSGSALDYRNGEESTEAVRLTYELKPTLSVFSEAEINQRGFDKVAPPDGIARDSSGERFRLGLDLGSTGQIWRGEVSIGYGRQALNNGLLDDIGTFLVDANLTWRPSAITSFILSARSDIAATTTPGSAGVISRLAGIEMRHAFRRYVVATGGLTYTDYDYQDVPIHESDLVAGLGLEYYASPDVILYSKYQHVAYRSNQPASDYDEDEVRVGVRVRR